MTLQKLAPHLAALAIVFAISAGIVVAKKTGLIDGDSSLRFLMAFNGLVLAFYANAIPKVVLRTERARNMRRLSGWAFLLPGLAYAAIWAFAPLAIATEASVAVVAAAVIVVVGACLLSRRQTPAAQ